MSTRAKKKLDRIMRVLDHLSQDGRQGTPILVEGQNDRQALQKLNICGIIICIKNSGKILLDVLDHVQSSNIILLVDFDEGGITLVKRIFPYFERIGVNVNLTFWRRLKALLKRDVKDVEGIPSYLEKLKKRVEPPS